MHGKFIHNPIGAVGRLLALLAALALVAGVAGSATADSTVELAPAADTFISDGSPVGNFGGETLLKIDAPPPNELRVLMRFPEQSGDVTSATLRLYAYNGGDNAGALHEVQGPWTESGVTWNNAPSVGQELLDLPDNPSGTYEVDVTSVVQAGYWEWYFIPASSNGIHYASKEHSNASWRPELIVTISDGGTTTTIGDTTTTSSSTTSTSSSTTTSTSSTTSTTTSTTTTTTLPPAELGPKFVVAGDIADCSWTRDSDTAELVLAESDAIVLTAGDNIQSTSQPQDYERCYEPTWGQFKDRTYFTPGNHDYTVETAYYAYTGAEKYYSFDYEGWHFVMLNSEIASGPSSAQYAWLQQDLVNSDARCTVAVWHRPVYSSNGYESTMRSIFDLAVANGVDLIFNGHKHHLEVFKPMDESEQFDPTGTRQVVAGIGGAPFYPFPAGDPAANSEVRDDTHWGIVVVDIRYGNGYTMKAQFTDGSTVDLGYGACS